MVHELTAMVALVADDRFDGATGSGGRAAMAPADEQAPTGAVSPMEALLLALGGCLGMAVTPILRKMRQQVTRYEIRVSGALTERSPRVFESIAVEHHIVGVGLDSIAIERALTLAETRYCGASAMLGKAARITHALTIMED